MGTARGTRQATGNSLFWGALRSSSCVVCFGGLFSICFSFSLRECCISEDVKCFFLCCQFLFVLFESLLFVSSFLRRSLRSRSSCTKHASHAVFCSFLFGIYYHSTLMLEKVFAAVCKIDAEKEWFRVLYVGYVAMFVVCMRSWTSTRCLFADFPLSLSLIPHFWMRPLLST